MKVAFLQYDVVHNKEKNFDHIVSVLRQQRCELLVLPELSLCGYLFSNRKALAECAETVPAGISTQRMMILSKEYACTIVFGLAEKENGKFYNTAVVVSKGKYIGKYRKIHLSDFEKKLFERGTENLVFELDGIKIGVQICFDLWFPEVSREQLRMGADIFCVLANFGGETTYHISKIRAIENLTPLVLCNRIGEESLPDMDAKFLGKSTILDASGQSLCVAPERQKTTGCCEVSISKTRSNIICNNFDREIAFHY
ncbi:carbon-nitrogen hydrolase family protein [uncultured Ruthenibacterium sp.]|uniref:carbon-nitrogen hydrolase family protein n=1 Tax=uncultured Ruthenibacterium sp. TaxID=1905347 RepID=UPI00349E51AC